MRSNWPTSHASAEHDDNLAVTAAAPLAWVQFNSFLRPVGIALDEIRPWTKRSLPMTAGAKTRG
jgi:hypothetical protein